MLLSVYLTSLEREGRHAFATSQCSVRVTWIDLARRRAGHRPLRPDSTLSGKCDANNQLQLQTTCIICGAYTHRACLYSWDIFRCMVLKTRRVVKRSSIIGNAGPSQLDLLEDRPLVKRQRINRNDRR